MSVMRSAGLLFGMVIAFMANVLTAFGQAPPYETQKDWGQVLLLV